MVFLLLKLGTGALNRECRSSGVSGIEEAESLAIKCRSDGLDLCANTTSLAVLGLDPSTQWALGSQPEGSNILR